MYDNQEETGRIDNSQVFGGNFIHEGNLMAEGEEIGGQYNPEANQYATNDYPP
jgi:hypothetical protein